MVHAPADRSRDGRDRSTGARPTEETLLTSQTHDGPRILVVEDDPVNQKVLARMLELRGYSVEVAEHGGVALSRLSECPFSLVLMDMQMPVLDGFETTRRIRQQPQLTGLPIVACTALALNGDRERCLQAGCDDYLSKPVLRVALDSVLARWAPRSTAPGGLAPAS